MISFTRTHWFPIFVILLMVAMSAIFLIYQNDSYASLLTRQELKRISEMAVIEHDIFLEQTRHALSILAELPQIKNSDSEACGEVLASFIGTRERYTVAGVIELDGYSSCSAIPVSEPVYAGDRGYFQRALESSSFSVGDYQIGRVSGRPSVNFGYPVRNDAGNIQSVVFVAVDLSWLQEFRESAYLPSGTILTLIDNQGLVLTRYPNHGAQGIEAPEVSYNFERMISIGNGAGFIETRDANGLAYYIIATPLRRESQEGYLHLLISVPKENLLID